LFQSYYDQELALCVENNITQPVTIVPPNNFDFLVDEQGTVYDTLHVLYDGVYNLRVLDEQGCPSLPASPIRFTTSYIPNSPVLQSLGDFGYTNAVNEILCEEGKLYLGAYNFNNDELTNLWSTGDTTQYITVEDDVPVWVKSVSPAGCVSEASDTLYITTVSSSPATDIEILPKDANTNICATNSVDLKGPDGFANYHWKHMGSFNFDQEINVRFNEELFLSLQVESAEGCWSEPVYMQIEIDNSLLPPRPAILQLDNLLSSDIGATRYQWYRDGEVISGETEAFINTVFSGDYQMRVGNAKCWGPLSPKLNIP
jgi:hypothetical protein